MGAWSLSNKSIIIDTKRRSTSYEYRLLKYYKLGFTIIFPGLNNSVMIPNNRAQELIEKLNSIALESGYKIQSPLRLVVNTTTTFRENQLSKNILPFLNINDGCNCDRNWSHYDDFYEEGDEERYEKTMQIGTNPYDKQNIEDRYINKISDYSADSQFYSNFSQHANASKLRAGNLDAVVSILEIDNNNNIHNKLLNEVLNPDIKLTESIIEHYKTRLEHIRKRYYRKRNSETKNDYEDFKYLSKCFYKYTPEVIKIRNNKEEYYKYRDILIKKMIENSTICEEKLKGIKWITKNPGRQWTSSINPIIEDPRIWYGDKYIPVLTGIPKEIETCLRLMRFRGLWSLLPDDIFSIIMLNVMKNYANEAWKYI